MGHEKARIGVNCLKTTSNFFIFWLPLGRDLVEKNENFPKKKQYPKLFNRALKPAEHELSNGKFGFIGFLTLETRYYCRGSRRWFFQKLQVCCLTLKLCISRFLDVMKYIFRLCQKTSVILNFKIRGLIWMSQENRCVDHQDYIKRILQHTYVFNVKKPCKPRSTDKIEIFSKIAV